MITFKTDLIPEEYKINELLESILDEQFPKGDKSRGKALVLFAITKIQIQEERNKVINEIERMINECDTPDNNKLKVYLKGNLNKLKKKQ